MKRIKTFFRTLYLTFTDPNYYSDVKKATISFSFKYFLIFYLLLSLVFTIYSWYFIKGQIEPRIDGVVDEISSMYPSDLILSFDGESNLLSTEGVDEPISIPLPKNEYIETDLKNLVVIDTEASAEDITAYESVFLLTDSHLSSITDQSSSFQIFSFSELSEYFSDSENGHKITKIDIDKSFVESNLPMIKLLIHRIAEMLPLFLFFGAIIFFIISRVIFLLVFSLFNAILSSILNLRLKYFKIFQIGLHTVTVAEGVTKLSTLVFRNRIDSLFTWVFMGVSLLALFGVRNKKRA